MAVGLAPHRPSSWRDQHGNILSGEEAKKYLRCCREDEFTDTRYLLEFEYCGEKYLIDGLAEDGSQGRLINHSSKHPNIKRSPYVVEGRLHLLFVAIKNIDSGAELFYDYGQRSDYYAGYL